MTRIELCNLSKTYPHRSVSAVTGVSLEVAAHTLLALLGPSGSGKSTILRLIAGIERPDRGDIRFDGRSILDVPVHRRSAVLMFQKAYLFPFLSVAENVAFGLRAQGVRRETIHTEVARMLALVDLPGMERRRPAELSGGEQQRVALARALITRPRVLLLDEPFSSLDPAVRRVLQEAVRRIQRELGITTILVTHDRSEALAMADCVALIEQGALIARAAPQQLYDRPPTRRAARQMGVEAFLEGIVQAGRLQCPFGPLDLAEPPLDGIRALYAIRPEHLRLLPHPAPNAVAVQLQTYTFHGDYLEYRVCAGTHTFLVRMGRGALWNADEAAYLQFPPEHLFSVLDDAGEGA